MNELFNIKERLEKVEALIPDQYAHLVQSLRDDIRYLLELIEYMHASYEDQISKLTVAKEPAPKTPRELAYAVYMGSVELLMALGIPGMETTDLSIPDVIDLGNVSPALLSDETAPKE